MTGCSKSKSELLIFVSVFCPLAESDFRASIAGFCATKCQLSWKGKLVDGSIWPPTTGQRCLFGCLFIDLI